MAPRIAGAEYTVHNVQLTGPLKRISDFGSSYLINMSDPVFVMGCYNVNPNGKKQLVSDPSHGYAPADCDSCHDNQQWQAIVKVDCREWFDLTLVLLSSRKKEPGICPYT
jgi:hypothetical protein